MNGLDMARQIGLLPPAGSNTEQRMNKLFNRRTSVATKIAGSEAEQIADGVWIVRGGFPSKTMNVYLLEDEGGVTVFDAGIESMTKAVAAAGARLGGIKRVVLGHGHADHRGAAPGLGVPVLCHPDNRQDAESDDGGERYFDFSKLDVPARFLMPKLLAHWDGGPVEISGTVKEGDAVAGFEVIDLPGHAPGLIGLWRESDRLALVSDCFYTLDPQTGKKGHARVPHRAFNQDTEQARTSLRKLAALEPAAAWAGHADPVRGDVRSLLEQAAATT
jgi:glyoxylase-like metal-dependent hydrolase (beta-lactamase superfamily II)